MHIDDHEASEPGLLLGERYQDDGVGVLNLTTRQRAAKADVASKVRQGTYAFEQVCCAVCGGCQSTALALKDRCGLYTPVEMCSRCGLIATNPRMTEASYREYYDHEYRILHDRESTPLQAFARERRRGEEIHRYLHENRALPAEPRSSFVVEVGCGAGGILGAFQSRGYTCCGLDIASARLEYGRTRHGLDLRAETLVEAELPRAPDLVIYSHVLEHVLDVGEELGRLREVLAPDGTVYIEVPGVKRLDLVYEHDFLRYLQNAHVHHFSLRTLTNLLEKHGFERVAGDERARSAFRVSGRSATGWRSDVDDALAALRVAEQARVRFRWKASARSVLHRAGLLPLARRAMARFGR